MSQAGSRVAYISAPVPGLYSIVNLDQQLKGAMGASDATEGGGAAAWRELERHSVEEGYIEGVSDVSSSSSSTSSSCSSTSPPGWRRVEGGGARHGHTSAQPTNETSESSDALPEESAPKVYRTFAVRREVVGDNSNSDAGDTSRRQRRSSIWGCFASKSPEGK